jgi:predicted MFS family arabinose efflux permease
VVRAAGLSHGQLKAAYYGLTAVSTLASNYYFNFLFFFLRDRFGFGDRQNLWVSALHGGIYVFSAWQCGKFAERRGFHLSLKVGFAGLFVCMLLNGVFMSATGIVLALAAYSVVLLFIWPALEALVTENEPPGRVPHMIGLFNSVWSLTGAVAYFTGGPLYDWLGAGAVFAIPAVAFLAQFAFVLWLGDQTVTPLPVVHGAATAHHSARLPPQSVPPQTFLKLAWLANPLAYVAIYTLLAVVPGLADKLGLSPSQAGVFCAIWMFARFASFIVLWRWTAWHYRFSWLAGAYAILGITFATMLMSERLWIIVLAQVGFGLSVGLIYYSSLFYSMDVGDARAEHGGLHEAAIGAGVFAGPAIGAASLQLFPHVANAAAIGVTAVLAAGFIPILMIWQRGKTSA